MLSWLRNSRTHDFLAALGFRGTGVFVIACVFGMLGLVLLVAIPLFKPASATRIAHFSTDALSPHAQKNWLAIGLGDWQETAYAFNKQGELLFFSPVNGQSLHRQRLHQNPARVLKTAQHYGAHRFSLLWDDGSLSLGRVVLRPQFHPKGKRTIAYHWQEQVLLPLADKNTPLQHATGRVLDENASMRVNFFANGKIAVLFQIKEENLLGETTLERRRHVLTQTGPALQQAVLNAQGSALIATFKDGRLKSWELGPEDVAMKKTTPLSTALPTADKNPALGVLLGGGTFILGSAQGVLQTWFETPQAVSGLKKATANPKADRKANALTNAGLNIKQLGPIYQNKDSQEAITWLASASRTRSFFALDAKGQLHMHYALGVRHLLTLPAKEPILQVGLSPRDHALLALNNRNELSMWSLHVPHPEASWSAFFNKQHYESYPKPQHVWQSSAADTDFEPKFGLMPLVVGSVKAAVFAMLFAAPLGILGAMYTSSFMASVWRQRIKSIFEIIGSVPSVVLGFLAAFWLAPLIHQSLMGVVLWFVTAPLFLYLSLALLAWSDQRLFWWRKLRGYEFFFLIPLILLGLWLAFHTGQWIEHILFQGPLSDVLFNQFEVLVDRRNAIVIAIALGFAVIPNVFTIAEDAFSNIPKHLSASSLALGASRWQTMLRVVMPSASPGLFAALMIGLGRAVGETMIVLMAAGNTPLLDFNPFTGMRTLSANIAVEIPEAPHGETLYRLLFFSATLLFIATFVLNTIAETVRVSLRKRFHTH